VLFRLYLVLFLVCLTILTSGPAMASSVARPAQPPPLFHGHWCGLGDADRRAPIDALDAACQAHDLCYERRGRGACSCDRAFLRATAALSRRRGMAEALKNMAAMANTIFTLTPCVEIGQSPLPTRKR